MNTKKYMEGEYVNAQLIKDSPTKRACILSEGIEDKYMDKFYIKLMVEMDGQRKMWRVNRKSLENLNKYYGEETNAWVGKFVQFLVENSKNGMEMAIAFPIPTPGSIPGVI